jgi:hypothetical protein
VNFVNFFNNCPISYCASNNLQEIAHASYLVLLCCGVEEWV